MNCVKLSEITTTVSLLSSPFLFHFLLLSSMILATYCLMNWGSRRRFLRTSLLGSNLYFQPYFLIFLHKHFTLAITNFLILSFPHKQTGNVGRQCAEGGIFSFLVFSPTCKKGLPHSRHIIIRDQLIYAYAPDLKANTWLFKKIKVKKF